MKHLPLAIIVAVLPSVVTAALLLIDATSPSMVLLAVSIGALVGISLFWPYLRDLETIRTHIRQLLSETSSSHSSRKSRKIPADPSYALSALRHLWHRKVQDAEERLASVEAVLDILPDPLLILSAQRRILRANRAATELFNQDLSGREVVTLIRAPALLESLESLLNGANETVDFPTSLPVASGKKEQDFQVRLSPLSTRSIDEAVATLTLHDISSVKKLDRMRADFIANASHELRTPLTSFLGFTETLQGPARDDPEAHQRFLALMHEQGIRMSRLIDDLLSLSRIEMSEHLPPSEEVDLKQLLFFIADGLEVQAKRKSMSIVFDMPEELPSIPGQTNELEQVFRNLMDNALKYGRAHTPVTIKVALDSPLPPDSGISLRTGCVMISICDCGEGIAQEHLPRLTERFFRVDSARSKQLGGTGLGLAIVKHIINHHRGRLVIDSTLGQGSTFTVYLPKSRLQ